MCKVLSYAPLWERDRSLNQPLGRYIPPLFIDTRAWTPGDGCVKKDRKFDLQVAFLSYFEIHDYEIEFAPVTNLAAHPTRPLYSTQSSGIKTRKEGSETGKVPVQEELSASVSEFWSLTINNRQPEPCPSSNAGSY